MFSHPQNTLLSHAPAVSKHCNGNLPVSQVWEMVLCVQAKKLIKTFQVELIWYWVWGTGADIKNTTLWAGLEGHGGSQRPAEPLGCTIASSKCEEQWEIKAWKSCEKGTRCLGETETQLSSSLPIHSYQYTAPSIPSTRRLKKPRTRGQLESKSWEVLHRRTSTRNTQRAPSTSSLLPARIESQSRDFP